LGHPKNSSALLVVARRSFRISSVFAAHGSAKP